MNLKNMKFLPLFLITTALIFSACGEDDKDTPNSPTDKPEEINPGEDSDKPEQPLTEHYVLLSASEITRSPSGLISEQVIFNNPVYEIGNGPQTVLKSYDNEYTKYRYIYSLPNSVACYGVNDIECTLTMGRITNAQIGRESHKFEYDSKHRLITTTYQYGSAAEQQITTCTYDDKYNMIGYKRIRYNKQNNDEEVIKAGIIEYTSIPAKTIPLQCFGGSNIFNDLFRQEMSFLEMGLYGNTIPLYLVDRIILGETETEFDYKLDNNGYVVEMIETTYTPDATYITTYNFEWKAVSIPSYTNWLFSDIGSPYYRYL